MFRFTLRRMATVCGCVFASILMVAPAEAEIVFDTKNLNQVENVLIGSPAPGYTLIGTLSQSNHEVLFSQPVPDGIKEIIRFDGQGQASIVPNTITNNDQGFTALRTELVNGDLFSRFVIYSKFTENVTIRVQTDDGTYHEFSGSPNGQNTFSVLGTNGTAFRFIDLIAPTNTLASVSQVRIGGITPAEVPEPSTWVMLTMGLGIVFGIARRKRASQQLAADGLA